jgi:1-acyl-sn-glycerol-3-phosphate acyltransferase
MFLNSIYRFILRICGWKIINAYPQHLSKFIIIVVPHTSWFDIVMGFLVRRACNVEYAKFLGKDSLFKGSFAWFFRFMGGYPVNRSESTNFVQEVVKIFEKEPVFVLGMSPEGTRKSVEKWRTGFYYIAKGAGVPIIPTAFDFGRKQIYIHPPFVPTDDVVADIAYLQGLFEGVRGRER